MRASRYYFFGKGWNIVFPALCWILAFTGVGVIGFFWRWLHCGKTHALLSSGVKKTILPRIDFAKIKRDILVHPVT